MVEPNTCIFTRTLDEKISFKNLDGTWDMQSLYIYIIYKNHVKKSQVVISILKKEKKTALELSIDGKERRENYISYLEKDGLIKVIS